MGDFLNKYTSVYNVFLDNWSYQSQYVLFLEKLMYEETILPTGTILSFYFGFNLMKVIT